jgi:hypothetical protein
MKRRGPFKTNVAMAHLILRIIYKMLKERKPYQELGWDYLPKKQKNVENLVKQIETLGFQVQLQKTETA